MMPERPRPAARPTKRLGLFLGVLLMIAAITYLIATSIGNAQVYYLTIAELRDQSPSPDRVVRVSGAVEASSVRWDESQNLLQFALVEQGERLPVVYQGFRPDMLRDEATAVVEGKLRTDGVFEAQSLTLKCPSKYEAAATATAVR